jgi:hypothetical protein
MALPDDIAADLAELETELAPDGVNPHTFSHNGIDYPCTPGSVTRGKTLGSGGFSIEADLVLFVRAILFPTEQEHAGARPESKEKLTYNNRSYRIEDVVTPAGEPFFKLICVDPNRRLGD